MEAALPQHIGVAISGGGHRASIWGLGTLLYLVDSGRNGEVAAISSVSGGSITNGVVAHEVDYSTTDTAAFDAKMKPMVKNIADVGLFFPGKATNKYVALLLLILAAGLIVVIDGIVQVCVHGLIWRAGFTLLIGLAVLIIGIYLLEQRSKVLDRALAKTYFHRNGHPTRLADVAQPVDHVICSTELQSGQHCYFSPRFVYGYAFGVGQPNELRLSTAVQASACLPAAFVPARIKASTFDFAGGATTSEVAKKLVLTDGGVYDNMADQWLTGMPERLVRLPQIPAVGKDIDELIIVNGSSPVPFVASRRVPLALLREVKTVLRVNSVMYQVTTQRRRAALIDNWEAATARGSGQQGALVHIAQSPYTVADAYRNEQADGVPTARAERARAVIELLGDTRANRATWRQRSDRSAAVGTVLKKLGREPTLDLLEHSYILTMCNVHILLKHPLPAALPDRERFRSLLA
jgi:predicted acylesterase/phospholipase RssA